MKQYRRYRRGGATLVLLMLLPIFIYGLLTVVPNTALWWWPNGQPQILASAGLSDIWLSFTDQRLQMLLLLPIFLIAVMIVMTPRGTNWITRRQRAVNGRFNTRELLLTAAEYGLLLFLIMLLLFQVFVVAHTGWQANVVWVALMIAACAAVVMLFWGLIFQCCAIFARTPLVALVITMALAVSYYFFSESASISIWTPTRAQNLIVQALQQANIGNKLATNWLVYQDALVNSAITLIFCTVIILVKTELVKRTDYLG